MPNKPTHAEVLVENILKDANRHMKELLQDRHSKHELILFGSIASIPIVLVMSFLEGGYARIDEYELLIMAIVIICLLVTISASYEKERKMAVKFTAVLTSLTQLIDAGIAVRAVRGQWDYDHFVLHEGDEQTRKPETIIDDKKSQALQACLVRIEEKFGKDSIIRTVRGTDTWEKIVFENRSSLEPERFNTRLGLWLPLRVCKIASRKMATSH